MKYQLVLETENKVGLEDLKMYASMRGIKGTEVTFADQTHIPRKDILYVLQTDDMEMKYDERQDETGAYDALSPTAKEELYRLVKKGLEFGLGEVWNDAMDSAIEEALRYRQIG